VLLALVERRDRVVTKDELLALVWPGLVVEDNNLQVQVSTLRKLLGQEAIATVAGRGYRFTLEPTVDAKPSAPAQAGRLSVMVLPFQNLTGEPSQDYVADGLTASLTSDLSRIRDAFIVNAATAFTYKDKPTGAQQIGKELGVRFVLHGGVQRSGTKIRIHAQLADTTSDAQLWSNSFEGDQSDLFALQDRVTTLVGNSIGREMVIVAARKCEASKTNATAADLLLRARALTLRPVSLTNLKQIEDLCRQSLALEPNNAGAMVRLANSLAYQAGNFGDQMDESILEKKFTEAHDLALRAKEIDPDNPSIYTPIAAYALYCGDWEGGLRATETRLLLEPKNPYAYNNLASRFYYAGEPKRSIELLTQAINLDPKHPDDLVLANMGRAYFMLGDNDAAIEWLLRSLEQNSAFAGTYVYLAMAHALKGQDAKAHDAVAEVRRLAPNYKLATFAPNSWQPAAYKALYENKLVPAWRKAGLPE
jgi:TolB-like protein/tetratricopeptide (TPR) repeat protein